uniref:Alpha-1,2-fucosyltransferase n=1 Tax=viral metagenome TaxID=1070528 RepID=A0A6C0HIR7_9ZZZZ
MGGLGNQLFQIFATISYAFEHGHQFVFPYSDRLLVGKIRQTYWHNFLTNLTIFTTKNPVCRFSNDNLKTIPEIKESGFHYTKIPTVSVNKTFSLHGYYQSYKYFEAFQDKINAMILLTNQQKSVIQKYAKYLDGMPTISMHFRLGDYKEKQHFHPIMPKEYYESALMYILNMKYSLDAPVRILYFCEKEDNGIVDGVMDYISKQFARYSALQIVKVEDGIEDWQQLLLMSCCSDNIIANSSFSWWGAYFNQNKDKCVCYPGTWFGPAMGPVNLDDLFPPTWHVIV